MALKFNYLSSRHITKIKGCYFFLVRPSNRIKLYILILLELLIGTKINLVFLGKFNSFINLNVRYLFNLMLCFIFSFYRVKNINDINDSKYNIFFFRRLPILGKQLIKKNAIYLPLISIFWKKCLQCPFVKFSSYFRKKPKFKFNFQFLFNNNSSSLSFLNFYKNLLSFNCLGFNFILVRRKMYSIKWFK